jgi:hypothetical protein
MRKKDILYSSVRLDEAVKKAVNLWLLYAVKSNIDLKESGRDKSMLAVQSTHLYSS